MDSQKTEAVCACAKREREQRTKEMLMKAMISLDEIIAVKPEQDMIQIENTVAARRNFSRVHGRD